MFKIFLKISLIISLFFNQFACHASFNADNFDNPSQFTSQRQILSDEILEEIEEVYKYGKTILKLDGLEISDDEACALAQNKKISTVKQLILSNNEIGNEGAIALAKSPIIDWLDLDRNEVGNAGAAALSLNSIITVLYLTNNEIGDEGAQRLAQNSTIHELYLSRNKITDIGARYLAQNRTFTVLNLIDNPITKEGARAIIHSKIKIVALSPIKKILSKQFINTEMKIAGRDPQSGRLLSLNLN